MAELVSNKFGACVVLAIAAGIISLLQGCGGGGLTPAPAPTTAPTPTSALTPIPALSPTLALAPTTALVPIPAPTPTWKIDSPCVVEGSVKKCVEYLNAQYMGYDPDNETSPLGVTIRGQPRYNEKWLWCGGPCFRGQPDCYVAGSILNHKEMLTDGKYVSMPMDDIVGIIFQPTAIAEWITKCSWQFDGAAFAHTHGGCANSPGPTDCKDPLSAYYDICPDTKKPISDDYSCPTVTVLDCAVREVTYPATCYWKGAAFYSDARPNATLHPPNLTKGTAAGIRQMLKQRLKNQGNGSQTIRPPASIPLLKYWNEITMDGKVLQAMLRDSPKAAVAGVMYKKGSKEAYGFAQSFNAQFEKDWGVKLQIVALDFAAEIRHGKPGPFAEPEPFLEEVTV